MTGSSNDYVSKRALVASSAIVGIAVAVTLGIAIVVLIRYGDVQKARSDDNHARIISQRRINRRQARVLRDLQKITHPTASQFREQLKEGLKRCLREPSCRKLFPGAAQASRSPSLSSTHAPARFPPIVPTPTHRFEGGDSTSTPNRSNHRRPTTTTTPPTPTASSSPTPSSQSPPASPRPRPPVDVTAPLPAQVCTDIAAINCPRG